MKLTAHIPRQTNNLFDTKSPFNVDHEGYPRAYGRWTETGRDAKGVFIEFEADRLDVLAEVADTAITPKNVKQVWAAVRHEFVDKVGFRQYGAVPAFVLANLENGHGFTTVFDFLHNQRGLGFMGGTGCGTKIHQLSYSKVIGVKAGLDPLVTEVAQAWFNLMLGELKYLRSETKHLRDSLREDELVLTYGARPLCQKTVRYVGAKGYPLLRPAKESCSKCQAQRVAKAKAYLNSKVTK